MSKLIGNCYTTAMGILPHHDVEEALRLALSMDIPFWPQLPRTSYYEDMYAQISEHFPGIKIDPEQKELHFSLHDFYQDLDTLVENWDNEEYFRLTPQYSRVFHRFLQSNLKSSPYIRGQTIGPVSYGLKIIDEKKVPIIYHDEVREFIFPFIAKKVAAQYNEMAEVHPHPFVWVDEPGLEMVFMAFTGYTGDKAREDYQLFLEQVPGPKGVHLCGNPDWAFLLELELDILSVDALAWGHIFTRYVSQLGDFLKKGGIISWGITPTLTGELEEENAVTMLGKLEKLWDFLHAEGIDKELILHQSWLAPARCCLINTDGDETIKRSFLLLKELSAILREKYNLA